ncbi:hypothetical protein MNBD_UNCLBAC01-835 [hydrothermal vent metagenome]|uniref:THIF-type NAD/FAD binding fold domain-containing protein n=1 Tax=hydrothermal vent metagenome TaxID=652676 RepID=A0A3B1D994_9ZZZZ
MDNFTQYTQNADAYYAEAFQRNIGLLTPNEQKKLRHFKIAIAGVGGVGGFHLLTLLRLGFGNFHIADMDTYEVANFQRQCGAFMHTLGKNKSDTMKEIALSINPHAKIKSFNKGVLKDNVDEFLSDVDVLIDGIEFFSIEIRRLIFSEAQKRGIHVVTAGPLGWGTVMLTFSPTSMSFDQYFDINDNMTVLEKVIAFGVGLAPASLHMRYIDLDSVDLKSKQGPSLVSACQLCASQASTEILTILLKRRTIRAVPHYFQFDPYLQKSKRGYCIGGNRNFWQKIKRWYLFKRFA